MSVSVWEDRMLSDLIDNPDDVFIVTTHSSKIVHLWSLLRTAYPDQTVFLSIFEFRDSVFCDCVAENPMACIPPDAKRVYLHTTNILWTHIPKPELVPILTEV